MDLIKLLSKTGLLDKFPEGLKREDIYLVTMCKKQEQLSHGGDNQSFHYFQLLYRLVHNDANCRFSFRERNSYGTKTGLKERIRKGNTDIVSPEPVHPIDISTAVFLCCDNVARQDLVMHYWACKHAFPLVIKTEQLEPPMLYTWPLRCIYLNSTDASEIRLLHQQLKTVCTVKFSEQSISKSNILNIIMSKYETVNSTFFHRNCEGSSKNLSEVCNGMVEASVSFVDEVGPTLFLNLRGNCGEHFSQRNFLFMSCVVVILVCKVDEMNCIKDVLNNTALSCEKLLIVFADLALTEITESLCSKLEGLTDSLRVQSSIVAYKGMSHSELRQEIISHISSTTGTFTIQEIENSAKMNDFLIDQEKIVNTLTKAEHFSKKIIKTHKKNKNLASIFPMQGNECLSWAKSDLELYKLRMRKSREPLQKYREILEQTKQEMRNIQYTNIGQRSNWITEDFVNDVLAHDDENMISVYLRCLKVCFEDATCLRLGKLHENYQSLRRQRSIERTDITCIEKQLDEIDEQINNNSLTLNIFTREIGQIYETLISQNLGEEDLVRRYPKAAVRLLLLGHEVEIMDGRSNYVYINWIKSMLSELHSVLGNVRVKVVTVLGVQSSGKSTLLNNMFGSQFSVSSGRCTRGVHMYLTKASSDIAEEYSVDIFIVIDTEGLFSFSANLDEASDRGQKERELAAFVIGISHVTIINIMGEDVTYLRDLLPVTVHAFLRMDLVGLSPKCKILHHNVQKSNRPILLRHQTSSLEKELDKHTRTACEIENVPYKRFKDIIRFDSTHDTDYFPTLFENINGLEIVSPAYSQEVMKLKDRLIEDTSATGTLLELIDHIGYLWNAIKKESFVYEFQNIIDMEARTHMDKLICNLQWKSRREWQTLTVDFQQQIANCDCSVDLNQIYSNYKAQAKSMATEQLRENNNELASTVHESRLLAKAFLNIRDRCVNNLAIFVKERKTNSDSQIERNIKHRQTEIDIIGKETLLHSEIDDFLHDLLKNEDIPLDSKNKNICEISDEIFTKWCDEVLDEKKYKLDLQYNFEDDVYNCIHAQYISHRNSVDQLLHDKDNIQRNITYFERNLDFFLSSYGSSYRESEREKDLALIVVNAMKHFINDKAREIKTKRAFYYPEIFVDIILELKNHRHIRTRTLNIKPKFEIELAVSSCGEFIEQIKDIDRNRKILPNTLLENAENYFKYRLHEILRRQPNITELAELLSGILCQKICEISLDSLHQSLAAEMTNEYPMLKTKQGLIYFVLMQILEDIEILPVYLQSFEFCLQFCLSQEFDNIFCGENTISLLNVIHGCTERNLKLVSEKLSCIITTELSRENMSSMEVCLTLLVKSLEATLPVNDLKQYINYSIEIVDPQMIIELIGKNLTDDCTCGNIISSIRKSFFSERNGKIRNETIRTLMESFSGCKEVCQLCGEICCIVEENHEGMHKALMHKPIGLKSPSSKLTSATCFEEMENCQSRDQTGPLADWFIPTDISAETNSYWKYVFATYVLGKASQIGIENPKDVPKSWKRLTKAQEKRKIAESMFKINEL